VAEARNREKSNQEKGLGVLCPEAQADGVPCSELGRDCRICEKAEPRSDEPSANGAEEP
jgi:hypothetical protein